MTDQHPITPPFKMMQQWEIEYYGDDGGVLMASEIYIATQAARWGADQELDACCEWVEREIEHGREWSVELRRFRRPKPKSLAEEALLAIDTAVADDRLSPAVAHAVRRALERLQELEGQGDG